MLCSVHASVKYSHFSSHSTLEAMFHSHGMRQAYNLEGFSANFCCTFHTKWCQNIPRAMAYDSRVVMFYLIYHSDLNTNMVYTNRKLSLVFSNIPFPIYPQSVTCSNNPPWDTATYGGNMPWHAFSKSLLHFHPWRMYPMKQ